MTKYILRRLALTLLSVFAVIVVVFVSLSVVPGDAALARAGLEATTEQVEALRRELGLDQPMLIRFASWLGRLVRGDLGNSLATGRAILPDILMRIPATFELSVTALIVALATAIPLGIAAATRHNSALDFACRILALIGFSIPNFLLALLLVMLVALKLKLLPPSGFVPFLENPIQHFRYLLLPMFSLSIAMAATVMRMMRSAMLDVLRQDYMRTARAKGVPELLTLFRHGVPNAVRDVITIVGIQFGYLLGGAVVVETVFGWPGVGQYLIRAVTQRDFPAAQGAAMFTAMFFLLVTLVVDILYVYVDPRISYE